MKIQLFDDEDLKAVENTLFRAMVRAMRVVMKEGLVSGWSPPVEVAPPHLEPVAAPAEPPDEPVFGRYMEPPEPAATERAKRQVRRSYTDFVQTVPSKPIGYITVEDARELLTGMSPESAAVTLRNWIFDNQVKAVIARDSRMPPTKGLPGRLMVDKDSVVRRNATRLENAALPPIMRSLNGAGAPA